MFEAYADEAVGSMDDLINDNVRLPRKLLSAKHMDLKRAPEQGSQSCQKPRRLQFKFLH